MKLFLWKVGGEDYMDHADKFDNDFRKMMRCTGRDLKKLGLQATFPLLYLYRCV